MEELKRLSLKSKPKNPGAITKEERKGYHRRCLEEGLRNPCCLEKLKTRRRRRSKTKKEVWNSWKCNISLLKRKSSKGPRVKNAALTQMRKWEPKIVTWTISSPATITTESKAGNNGLIWKYLQKRLRIAPVL